MQCAVGCILTALYLLLISYNPRLLSHDLSLITKCSFAVEANINRIE